jgi:hypothetical protein
MRRTLLATTAVASMLAFGAAAQEAADPAVPAAPMDAPAVEAPADATPAEPAMPEADAAADVTAPEAPATETAQEPTAPLDPAAPGAAPMDPAVADVDRVLTPVQTAEISADALIGTTIQTMDGENIAEVEDVLVSADGAVEHVVAQFGGFLGFGSNKVLLTMDEIEVMQDEAGVFVVQTALTPESLEGRPEYQAEN